MNKKKNARALEAEAINNQQLGIKLGYCFIVFHRTKKVGWPAVK